MNFEERLKELRMERGWNQKRIADELGVTPATVSNWEAGRKRPDVATTIKLANMFDVSLDYLVGRSDNRTATHIYTGGKRWDDIKAIFEPGILQFIEFAVDMKEEDIDLDELRAIADFIRQMRKTGKNQ